MRLQLEELELPVAQRLRGFTAEHLARRLWTKDFSLWPAGPNAIGWLNVADKMKLEADSLKAFANAIKSDGFTDVLLLGMGGSSLCPDLFQSTFGPQKGYPKLHVLDSTDADQIIATEKSLTLSKTLTIVASKSGNTVEIDSLYRYFRSRIPNASNFIAITDANTALEELAKKEMFRKTFINPSDIGGRYSALSFFGLVPAALMGLDIHRLLSTATTMSVASGGTIAETDNVGVILGAVMGEAWLHSRDKMTLVLSKSLSSFGAWVEQLVAESTGKVGRGIVPIDGEPISEIESEPDDRFIVSLRLAHEKGYSPGARIPFVEIQLSDLYDVAGEFLRFEIATAIAGHMLGINPFDQPNVEESKKISRQILDQGVKSSSVPVEDTSALTSFIEKAQKGDYVGVLAYVANEGKTKQAAENFRIRISEQIKLPTTLGFGPRYLHSTGQLHKGGANNGVFIQIISDKNQEVPVPGKPYTFNELQLAQADGDFAALTASGRRVIRVHLNTIL